ncbi:MAG TPA: hypothetical protein VGD10_05350 [Allosphingosinicella sp.]|uniref:hypothetical protein n=1 Tax=Allosphingosinicella sp. TaxID=2823234 RepID=UPI002EDAF6A2
METGPARRRGWLSTLILPLVAFILGIALMGWLLSRWDAAATFLGISPAPVQPVAAAPSQQEQPAQAPLAAGETPQTLLIDPEMQRRVAQLEQRIAQIDVQSRAAVGNADRAEGLLVAFAARRALDRGVSLGYIEALLRQRFGANQRQAVATIITASRQPVTLEDLQEGLIDSGPSLTGVGRNQGWWTAFRAELADLVTVRREGTPSTMPAERLRRATRRLEAGQVDVALAEVLRMPGRDNAPEWIADARRYVAARRALDTIETAALLEPRLPQAAPALPAATPAAIASPAAIRAF